MKMSEVKDVNHTELAKQLQGMDAEQLKKAFLQSQMSEKGKKSMVKEILSSEEVQKELKSRGIPSINRQTKRKIARMVSKMK